ncbi:MAG: GNAT family N-acetyltransferase [Casimicrobiaceae bacterium]
MSLRGTAGRSAYPKGSAVRRAALTLRGEGLRSFWFKLLGHLGYRRLLLFEWPLDQPVPDFSPTLPVEIGQLAESAVDDYLAFRPGTQRGDAVGRLRSGQLCFFARSDGRIVGAGWITAEPYWLFYLGCAMPMEAGDVHAYDKFTLPAYRGHGISNALRMHHRRHLQHAGYGRVVVAVLP